MDAKAQSVLDFWFVESDKEKWFNGGDAFDAEIKEKFSDIFEQAINGQLNAWADQPQSALALIILIDQFSRNMFRNTKDMFKHDHIALNCCKQGIVNGFVEHLTGGERLFFIMPLIHSENLVDQNYGIECLIKYYSDCEGYEQSKKFYDRHKEIIERFGRFPHRNKILGRTSTAEEEAFLNEPFSSF